VLAQQRHRNTASQIETPRSHRFAKLPPPQLASWPSPQKGARMADADAPSAEPDPRSKLMHEVAEQMDAIEADFGDGYQIGRVITVVEVVRPDENVEIRVRAGQLPWVTLGMLDWAKKSLEAAIGGQA
jgi:hypothetical protein